MRESACDAGAGEYYIDENNERQFRWVVVVEEDQSPYMHLRGEETE